MVSNWSKKEKTHRAPVRANIERTTKLATTALHDFNRAVIPALDRYKLLEIYARPTATVLPHLP